MTESEHQDEKRQHHETVHIKINGVEHKTHRGGNSVEHLRQLGRIPEHEILLQEREGKQVGLDEKGQVDIRGDEVFVSHNRHHNHHEVDIKINRVGHKTHTGENSVEHLKHLGLVQKDDILAEYKDHHFVDLGSEGQVDIHGGEVFMSHCHGAPLVEVTNLNTNESVEFFARWEETLQQVWTTAYADLKESPQQGDELLCEGGASLMQRLNSTLAQLRDEKVCPHRKFQLRRATGGA
jgi:hypothetical protein